MIVFLIQFSTLNLMAQNVGIGILTPEPSAVLHINASAGSSVNGFLVTGVFGTPSNFPNLGAGSRLMFYPAKSAFRAGYVTGTQWDDLNTGYNSVAMGYNTLAGGEYSTALGYGTKAQGQYSTAMGYRASAAGQHSIATGEDTEATGYTSIAMGGGSLASGVASVAIGNNLIASGDFSFAAGSKVSTNNRKGSFFFGDSDPNYKGVRALGFNDHFAARFNGGYYFISSDVGSDIGVRVLAGGNSWVTISDVNRKENFLPVDGESFLQKIAKFNLTTWNYKGQSVAGFRHYGPMAQEFNEAFGKDDLGTIGCDTLINQQDFLGVNLIAIQALERRTADLKKDNEELKAKLNDMEALLKKYVIKKKKVSKSPVL